MKLYFNKILEVFLRKSFSNYLVTFASVAIAVAVIIAFKLTETHSLIARIYLFTFSSCGFFAIFLLAKAPVVKEPVRVNKIEISVLLLLVLVCLYVSISGMASHHFWLDEYTHAIHAADNPFDGSTLQQQALLGYLWSKILTSTFGQTISIVRMTSTIPYLCSLFILSLLGLRHKGSYLFLVLFFVFHLNNGLMRYISIDARSIGTALLFMSITVNSWLEYQEHPHPVNCTFFGLSVFLFLNSVGLQPILIMSFMLATHFAFWFIYKEKTWLLLSLAMFCALVAYLPIQLYISLIAHNMGYFNLSLLDRLHTMKLFPPYALYSFWLPNNSYVVGSVTLITCLWIWLRHNWTLKQKKIWFLTILFFLLFPLLFEWSFYLFLNWNVQPWYRSCFVAFFIFLFSLTLANISKDWKYSFIPVLCFIIVVFSPGLGMYHEFTNKRDNWEILHKELRRLYPEDNWTAYVTGLCDTTISWWCNNLFVGAEFFDNSFSFERTPGVMSKKFKFYHPYLSDNSMGEDLLVPFTKKRYVLAILVRSSENPLLPSEYGLNFKDEEGGFKAFRVDHFIVVSSTKPMDKQTGILSILKWIITHNPPRPAFYYPYELLIQNLVKLNRKDEARLWLNRLKEISGFMEAIKSNVIIPKKISSLEDLVKVTP